MTAIIAHPALHLMPSVRTDTVTVLPCPNATAAAPADVGRDHLALSSQDAAAVFWSRGVSRGDPAALDGLYRAWFDRAFRTAKAATQRDEAFCLDVVQSAMLRAINSLPPLSTRAALDAWMHAAVRSAALDALRAEARRLKREARHSTRRPGPVEHATVEADLEDLSRALADLGATERELLALRFDHHQTLAQTGAATGRTRAATHGLIRRALATLRVALTQPGQDQQP